MTKPFNLEEVLTSHRSISSVGKMTDITFSTKARLRYTRSTLFPQRNGQREEPFVGAELIEVAKMDDFGTAQPEVDMGREKEMLSSPRADPWTQRSVSSFLAKKRFNAFQEGMKEFLATPSPEPNDSKHEHQTFSPSRRKGNDDSSQSHMSASFMTISREQRSSQNLSGPTPTKYSPQFSVVSRRSPFGAVLHKDTKRVTPKSFKHQYKSNSSRNGVSKSPGSDEALKMSFGDIPKEVLLSNNSMAGPPPGMMKQSGTEQIDPAELQRQIKKREEADRFRVMSPCFRSGSSQRPPIPRPKTPEVRWPIPETVTYTGKGGSMKFENQTLRNSIMAVGCGAKDANYEINSDVLSTSPKTKVYSIDNHLPARPAELPRYPANDRSYTYDMEITSNHERTFRGNVTISKCLPPSSSKKLAIGSDPSELSDATILHNTIAKHVNEIGTTVVYDKMADRSNVLLLPPEEPDTYKARMSTLDCIIPGLRSPSATLNRQGHQSFHKDEANAPEYAPSTTLTRARTPDVRIDKYTSRETPVPGEVNTPQHHDLTYTPKRVVVEKKTINNYGEFVHQMSRVEREKGLTVGISKTNLDSYDTSKALKYKIKGSVNFERTLVRRVQLK